MESFANETWRLTYASRLHNWIIAKIIFIIFVVVVLSRHVSLDTSNQYSDVSHPIALRLSTPPPLQPFPSHSSFLHVVFTIGVRCCDL